MSFETEFASIIDTVNSSSNYKYQIIKVLKKIIPTSLLEENVLKNKNTLKTYLNEKLPLVKHSKLQEDSTFSIYLITYYKGHIKDFFYNMISRWLKHNNNLNMDLFFSIDFNFLNLSINQKLTLLETTFYIKKHEDIEMIKKNIVPLQTEIKLGVISEYQANKIIEFKGLSYDKKMTLVQDKIGTLIKSKSKDFGKSIFSDMQHFLVTCRDEFKLTRSHNHISRIISILYIIRKLLLQKIQEAPTDRHIIVKFLKNDLKIKEEEKHALGILVGINLLKENEVFGKNHFIKSLKENLFNIKIIDDSFFINRKPKEAIQIMYLEIEKTNKLNFMIEEINIFKKFLPNSIKTHIEHMIHPLFISRNEEELNKNILTLAHQLKTIQDIPQIIISFDKQTSIDLEFTIIFLRILKATPLPIKEILTKIPSKYNFHVEKIKRVGVIRRKYIKEANIIKTKLNYKNYIRYDNSIDVNKARKDLSDEIERIFGEVRDYNGGMIAKQNQSFDNLKNELSHMAGKNELLLEKFFYSIKPVEMPVIKDVIYLKNIFLMLLTQLNKNILWNKKQKISIKSTPKAIYAIISSTEVSKKKKIIDAIERLKIENYDLLYFNHNDLNAYHIGYVYFSQDSKNQKIFISTLQKFL